LNCEIKYLVFLFWGDYSASDFYVLMFQNTLALPSHMGHVKEKNNWDQIARVFIQVKVWLKRSLGQMGEGMGRGCV
jgi:hypothetical protein